MEKGGGWKTSRLTPLPKRGFGPPSYGTFSTPLTCQCSVFPVQKSTTEQTRSSFGGVQKFSGERVLWYVFHPPYVLHPPISRPNYENRGFSASRSARIDSQRESPRFALRIAGPSKMQKLALALSYFGGMACSFCWWHIHC